jgi:hypothetical protein
MAYIPIWAGSSSFTPGDTPYGFFDADPVFVTEADKFANWAAKRLGYPIVDVELQDINFYAALEEAVNDYGIEIFQYKLRDSYLSLEGNVIDSDSSLNNNLIVPNLGTTIRLAQTYGTEAGSGGNVTYYTGGFALQSGVQDYDMNAILAAQGISGSVEIKRIFYEDIPAVAKFYDPYGGLGLSNFLSSFGMGNAGIAVNNSTFLMMPVSFDVMRAQAIELSDSIRFSGYSFELVNNQLRIFPVPYFDGGISGDILDDSDDGDYQYELNLFFHYILTDERNDVVKDTRTNLITNISNVPYNPPVYGQINFMGQQWIRQYGLALVKEMLAYVRGKYISIPTPGTDGTSTQLNAAELITAATAEKEALLTQLRATLDETSRKTQLQNQMNDAAAISATFMQVPMPIYVF